MAGDADLLEKFNFNGWRLHPYDGMYPYIHSDVFVKGFCVESVRSAKRRHGYGDPYHSDINHSTIDVAVNWPALQQIPAAIHRLNEYTANELLRFYQTNFSRSQQGMKCISKRPCLKKILYADFDRTWISFYQQKDYAVRAYMLQRNAQYELDKVEMRHGYGQKCDETSTSQLEKVYNRTRYHAKLLKECAEISDKSVMTTASSTIHSHDHGSKSQFTSEQHTDNVQIQDQDPAITLAGVTHPSDGSCSSLTSFDKTPENDKNDLDSGCSIMTMASTKSETDRRIIDSPLSALELASGNFSEGRTGSIMDLNNSQASFESIVIEALRTRSKALHVCEQTKLAYTDPEGSIKGKTEAEKSITMMRKQTVDQSTDHETGKVLSQHEGLNLRRCAKLMKETDTAAFRDESFESNVKEAMRGIPKVLPLCEQPKLYYMDPEGAKSSENVTKGSIAMTRKKFNDRGTKKGTDKVSSRHGGLKRRTSLDMEKEVETKILREKSNLKEGFCKISFGKPPQHLTSLNHSHGGRPFT